MVRSDNAGEFTSEAWHSTLSKHGVGAETCAPGGSESIGAAERLNQTVKNNLDKLLEIMGLHDARDLWPWLVKAVELSLNHRYSPSVGAIPAQARNKILTTSHGRNEEDCVPPPFGPLDVVYFNTPRDKVGVELSVSGHREGIFLGYAHSGAAEVLTFQNGELIRFVCPAKYLQPGSPSRQRELLDRAKQYVKDWREPITREISSNRRLSTRYETKPLRIRQVQLRAAAREPYRRTASISTYQFLYEGRRYVLYGTPSKGTVKVLAVEDNHAVGEPQTMNIRDTFTQRTTVMLTNQGNVIAVPPARKTTGNYHHGIGYVAADEAPVEDVQNGLFEDADNREFLSILENCTFAEGEIPAGAKPIRCRWRRTWKGLAGGGRKAKSRLLVCATNDPRDVDTFTEMPSAWVRRLAMAYGLSNKWTGATIDVQTAFLLVPLPENHGEIFIRLPPTLPPAALSSGYRPLQVCKLRKTLYGLKEAPR